MRPFDRRSKVTTSGRKHRPVEVGTSNVPWKPSVVAFSCVRQTILDMEGSSGRGSFYIFAIGNTSSFLEENMFVHAKIFSWREMLTEWNRARDVFGMEW